MKTERRHELQTNVLADSLAHWIDSAKPYSRAALAVVIALVGAIFAWGYYSSQSTRQQADGWTEYYDAMMSRDPREGLSDVVERYAGTSVAQWAQVVLADLQLDDGTNRMFVDKSAGREELQKTIEAYQSILAETDQRNLKERATFGLARAREALGKDLAKARDDYRSIAKQWPNSPFAAPAEERAKDLDRLETKDFYDWFAKYEPPRPMSKEPGIPGVRPEFMQDPLEDAGLKLPSLLDDKSAPPNSAVEPAGEEKPPDPGNDKPAEPTDEKPTEPEAAAASESTPNQPASDEPK